MNTRIIDANGLHYSLLNDKINETIKMGEREIILNNVNGQRFICAGLTEKIKLIINGVPGNDLGAFMDGPTIIVNGNAQDGVGNTMNGGKIVVKGNAGDVCGYGMRGGKLFIQGDAGYRIGIHMKGYKDLIPVIIIGGNVGNFLAEYMAGGIIILLRMFGRKANFKAHPDFIASGMHGGVLYIRGEIDKKQLGKGVEIKNVNDEDLKLINSLISEYSEDLGLDKDEILKASFTKLQPAGVRPYRKLYVY
jgi:glutamate synthase domain-containing protein 3